MPDRVIVNWFSPLPPLPTDIANYSIAVIAALGRRADVRAWTSQGDVTEIALDGVTLHRFDPAMPPDPVLLNTADINFFNIGNNAGFHKQIFEIMRVTPGIAILHDTRLQHFFAAWSEDPGQGREDYYAWIERAHGAGARTRAANFVAGDVPLDDLVADYPMTSVAAEAGLAAIVHNRGEAAALAAAGTTPVYHLALPFPVKPPRPRAAPDPADRRVRLVMFGFIGLNRRLLQVLEALASLPTRDRYRLDVYGIIADELEAPAMIERLGLTAGVTVHGYVAEEVLDAALLAADLVLNLRWPSMGEASGSQLRIWDAQSASLVTRTGWYAELPAGTVFEVDPEHERRDLVRHLERVRAEPAIYAVAGVRGRALLERDHSPEHYVERLMAIARDMPDLHGRLAASRLVRRSARVLADAGGGQAALTTRDEIAGHALALLGPSRASGDTRHDRPDRTKA